MSDLFASKAVMRSYLNALLTEEEEPKAKPAPVVTTEQKKQLSDLLAQASPVQAAPRVVPQPKVVSTKQAPERAPVVAKPEIVVAPPAPVIQEVVKQTPPPTPPVTTVVKDYRQGRFQALFFEVAGLKVALPLKELGGIHQIGSLNTLPGKPAWYKGVMLYREQKINVVNTAMWVMPEKYDQTLAEKLNYQYVIMLGKSSWGLACETLVNTMTLEQDDVKWRASDTKRAWLAGLIKQHMCALLDVDAMISLLAQGSGSAD